MRKSFYIEHRDCDGKSREFYHDVPEYTLEQLEARYSRWHFLKLYLKLRLLEEESTFHESEKNLLIDNVEEMYYLKGESAALRNFEIILNKTFDYVGSLSYINKQMTAIGDPLSDEPSQIPHIPAPDPNAPPPLSISQEVTRAVRAGLQEGDAVPVGTTAGIGSTSPTAPTDGEPMHGEHDD